MTEVHPFDLQARAELGARCLTGLLDAERDGLLYFLGNWRARPPRADHCLWDFGDGSGRHVDALTLMRTMVRRGSPAAESGHGDVLLEGWMLRLLGPDGISWLPEVPYAEPWGQQWLLAGGKTDAQLAEISWAQRGTLLGLVSRCLSTADERYFEHARRMIDGLLRVALRDEHGLYFPEGYYRAGGWRWDKPNLHAALEEYNAAVVVPALRFYQATDYRPALDLAEGLVAGTLYYTPSYFPDGRLRTSEGVMENHFHTRSNFMLGVLQLGLVLRRREYVAWARQSYEQARAGGTEFGWFPEGFGMRHGEICCTTDMIEIALLLGQHVDRAYNADAERFGRNHLLESQFLSLDLLRAGLDRLPPDDAPAPYDGAYSTSHGVAESQVGGFAARSALNDAFHLDAAAMMQCCTAAGMRGLYDLWHYAVEERAAADGQPAEHAVHLRFSVETPHLRVVSHEPAEGRLDIAAAQTSRVSVRLPAGVSEAIVVRGAPAGTLPAIASPSAVDGYVCFDLAQGESATVHYPLPERVAHYTVGTPERSLHCIGSWRGETLMRVDPPGPFYPLYTRSHDLAPVQPALPAGKPIPSL